MITLLKNLSTVQLYQPFAKSLTKSFELKSLTTTSMSLSRSHSNSGANGNGSAVETQEHSTPGGPSVNEVAKTGSAFDPSKPDPSSSSQGVEEEVSL